jgi:hypothetical protein
MPKTAVETAVCDICGAEVRDGSVFCYNCGGSLAKDFQPPAESKPIETPPRTAAVETNGHSSEDAVYDPARRKAEKSDRRKVRAANRQPVEIVWEPRTGISLPFFIVSLVLFLLSIGIVIAAFFVR